jgi:hypothetical protein
MLAARGEHEQRFRFGSELLLRIEEQRTELFADRRTARLARNAQIDAARL